MNFSEEVRKTRQRLFLTQEDFAKEIGVAFSTVNRWEGGKSKPNLLAMKSINEFCFKHDVDFSPVEDAWLNYKTERNNG